MPATHFHLCRILRYGDLGPVAGDPAFADELSADKARESLERIILEPVIIVEREDEECQHPNQPLRAT